MVERFRGLFALVGIALGLALAGCSAGQSTDVSSVSVSSADPLTPAVGAKVTITVRAVMSDGTSTDVSDRASCVLGATSPPGKLEGRVFTATMPGTTDIRCTFAGVLGTLGITVPGALKTTIAKVQHGDVQAGTLVQVSAIVFQIDPDGRYTNFWAQDPGGGPGSGIYFRDVRALPPVDDAGVPDASVPPRPVAVNTVVTMTGKFAKRNGRSVINWSAVETTGVGAPVSDTIAVAAVDPAVWDGCLVTVKNVKVANPAFDKYTWQVSDVADPNAKVLIETLLFSVTPKLDDVYASITGPLYVATPAAGGATEVAIAPRSAADVVKVDAPPSVTTIADIQGGRVQDGATVILKGVVVTALDPDAKATPPATNVYVQDVAGGKHSGIYLRDFRVDRTKPIAVGDVTDVTGTFTKRKGRSVVNYTDLAANGTATPKVDLAPLAGIVLEDWESCLIRVTNVKVTNAAVDKYTWEVTDNAAGGTQKLAVDNGLFDPHPVLGTAYPAITGVVYRGQTSSALQPRSAADL